MRDTFFDVRGLTLHAIERGSGPLSVLLHGWLDHARSFDLLAPLLPGRTLSLDHRGHGDSQWVGRGGFYHFVEYLADLDGVLDAAAPDGPVRLVGHSMGAAIGLFYAAARPERVAHLTLIDGAPLAIGQSEIHPRMVSYLNDLRGVQRVRRRVESIDEAVVRMRRFNGALSEKAARLLAEGGITRDDAQGGLAWKWDPLLRAHSPLPYTEDAVQRVVAEVTTKVLAIRGATGFLPEEDELHARFPRLKLTMQTVPGTGHHVHLEEPEICAELIRTAWA